MDVIRPTSEADASAAHQQCFEQQADSTGSIKSLVVIIITFEDHSTTPIVNFQTAYYDYRQTSIIISQHGQIVSEERGIQVNSFTLLAYLIFTITARNTALHETIRST